MIKRKLMTLERLVTKDDGFSDGAPEKWEPVQEVWVSLRNWSQKGSHGIVDALQMQEAQNTHWGRMRFVEGVTAEMRLTYQGRVFAISNVRFMQEANRFLDLRLIEAK